MATDRAREASSEVIDMVASETLQAAAREYAASSKLGDECWRIWRNERKWQDESQVRSIHLIFHGTIYGGTFDEPDEAKRHRRRWCRSKWRTSNKRSSLRRRRLHDVRTIFKNPTDRYPEPSAVPMRRLSGEARIDVELLG